MAAVISLAENLVGMKLDGGWKVTSLIPKDPAHTGGYFSVGYNVESDQGTTGFLKAMDIKKIVAPANGSIVDRVQELTSAFVYERDILKACREGNLSRVIRSMADGEINNGVEQVPYIIFELASSDVRHKANALARFDLAWALRTMHHVAVGIKQLHGKGIAHQDLKPSNVLLMDNGDRKIGDLGRSATKDCILKHMGSSVAGDYNHAPPEGLYGFRHPDFQERRYGCDCYQLGSLIVFMLTGISATTILIESLDDQHKPGVWGGDYPSVLSYLVDGFTSLIGFIDKYIQDSKSKNEILTIIEELCHPDVDQRGDPRKRSMKANPFNMERYISRFDRLAKVVERELTQ